MAASLKKFNIAYSIFLEKSDELVSNLNEDIENARTEEEKQRLIKLLDFEKNRIDEEDKIWMEKRARKMDFLKKQKEYRSKFNEQRKEQTKKYNEEHKEERKAYRKKFMEELKKNKIR
ncbi:MAG: hypothetical protein PHW96_01920 [Candidatus Nanoarchaeia archaeon]|nr:hypothetical protein [Candidatus Nanoarchaeia archaeon]